MSRSYTSSPFPCESIDVLWDCFAYIVQPAAIEATVPVCVISVHGDITGSLAKIHNTFEDSCLLE
jgi:hypothetical protein